MGTTKVLIVDDDSVNLMIMEKMLEALDVEIISASSGAKAVKLCKNNDFALVLMDAQMPRMDGFEAAKKLRSTRKNKELPIIIVSAVSKTKDFILKGYKSGAVDYLLKPIEKQLLQSKVRIFCQLHEQKVLLESKNTDLGNLNKKLQQEIVKRTEAEEELLFQAIRDPLTGLFNRRYLEESLEREIAKSKRHKTPLGLIMLDIDHFKVFNDTYGHLAGDVVLTNLSDVLVTYSRREDIACRYGGEEFVLVLPGTSVGVAKHRAEELRNIVESRKSVKYEKEKLPSVTISLGVAVLPEHGTSREKLLAVADEALYSAKNAGRNKVVVAPIEKKTHRRSVAKPRR